MKLAWLQKQNLMILHSELEYSLKFQQQSLWTVIFLTPIKYLWQLDFFVLKFVENLMI